MKAKSERSRNTEMNVMSWQIDLVHFQIFCGRHKTWRRQWRASVLECGGPPPLFSRKPSHAKRRRAAAFQNLAEFSTQPSKSATVLLKPPRKIKDLVRISDFQIKATPLRARRGSARLHRNPPVHCRLVKRQVASKEQYAPAR